jgi:hypothetical protein
MLQLKRQLEWIFLFRASLISNYIPGGLDESDSVNKVTTQEFSADLDFEKGSIVP